MRNVNWLNGVFEGSGTWYESTGRSQSYRVYQANRPADNGFEVNFKHEFDDGEVIEAHFMMSYTTDRLFTVSAAGKAIGNGYLIEEICHYHLEVGPLVEVSLLPSRHGLSIFGSSSKNKEGHYIAWHETLSRSARQD